MARVFLQDMVSDVPFDALPVTWDTFDFEKFSKAKRLWDYQQEAVKNALKVLGTYYQDFRDYQPNETADAHRERKQKFYEWYRVNGLDTDLDIPISNNRNVAHLLADYYEVAGGKVPYVQFINRACFWMATGSGKTLVIVKLIQVLRELIRRGEMPPNDILFLTHRDDLMEQLKAHVNEFNAAHSDLFIRLRELREYAAVKRENPMLFKDREMTVFYYRSDNLSDEQKEKIIDFRNYDNDGRWYILLDEAHKGDKEDSKRQHIYSILSRNGFLFNFSATFTDVRDLVTTAYNFNLSEFIKAGYGKHIAIMNQQLLAFKEKEVFNDDEKQKIVLQSLILLTYASKFAEDVRSSQTTESNSVSTQTKPAQSRLQQGAGLEPASSHRRRIRLGGETLYHKPLLLTLVNSVNTEDADLKLFFRELERIGKGEIAADVWQAAKDELWEELKARPEFMFEEGERVVVDPTVFQSLSQRDVLQCVYNSRDHGDIEILVRPSNRQELAFKLKTSDRPFALIKIGDVSGWLKEELTGYEVNERFDDEGYFERLNADDSDINILMGSRSFYEGWDSNRPNVINFINIGTGTDAKKFILQSVGRGVRIEPLRNKRKRLLPLYNAKEVEESLFQQIKDKALPLETLFIFGTNRHALETVIKHLDEEGGTEKQQQLSLFVNEEATQRKLLIPTYKKADRPLIEQRDPTKFLITLDELDLLKRYVEFVHDDRVLLALHDTEKADDRVSTLQKIRGLRVSLSDPIRYYKDSEHRCKNLNLLVRRVLDHFSLVPKEFERLKELEEEIRHFRRITVSLKDIGDLKQRVDNVRQYQEPSAMEAALKEKFTRGEITLEEFAESIKQTARMVKEEKVEYQGKRLRIRHVANHYYIPLILSDEKERIDYIKHIVQTPSEVNFLNRLEQYVERADSKFKDFDWWLFSKLDESLDEVYIPYYNPKSNGISEFKPDFIFWLQKGSDYFIVFVDPHGTEHIEWEWKVHGYRQTFEGEDNRRRNLPHEGLKVKVFAFLYTDDVSKIPEGDKKQYWCDNMDKALGCVLGHS